MNIPDLITDGILFFGVLLVVIARARARRRTKRSAKDDSEDETAGVPENGSLGGVPLRIC